MSPAPALVVRGPAVPRADEILTPEALEFVADLQREFGGRRDELVGRRRERRAEIARTHRLDFLPETAGGEGGVVAGGAGPARPQRPAGRDHRPDRAKMAINALNSGAKVWLADLEDANTPHWANVVGGQVNATRRRPGHPVLHVPEGKQYALGRRPGRGRSSCGRAAGTSTSSTCCSTAARRRGARRTSGCTPSTTRPSCSAAAAARTSTCPRWRATSRRGCGTTSSPSPQDAARHPVRQRPRDRAHRDDPRRVRDGGDPLRAARPRERAQRRALGLLVQS